MREGVIPLSRDDSFEAFLRETEDLLAHPKVQALGDYQQHGSVSRLDHSLYVAYMSFRIATRLGLRAREAARGGLLHDLFFYDWHVSGPTCGNHAHRHPLVALQNARQYFTLTPREENIIESHMFPLGYTLPRYAESFVVTFSDKVCATVEVASQFTPAQLRRRLAARRRVAYARR